MDAAIYRWFNRLADHTSWAHGFFRVASNLCVALLALLLVAAVLDARRRNDVEAVAASVWAGVSILVALGIGQVVGGVLDRARPYAVITGAHLLVDRTTDVSFPSDHATLAGAAAAGLLLVHRRWGVPALIVAVVMAFTRVYVGAHYLSDVLAGLLLGAIVAFIGYLLIVPQLERLGTRLVSTRVGVVVASQPGAVRRVQ